MVMMAKDAVDKQMTGVPELFLKITTYESRHKEITDKIDILTNLAASHVDRKEFKPIADAVTSLINSQANTWKYISFMLSIAGLALYLHNVWAKVP